MYDEELAVGIANGLTNAISAGPFLQVGVSGTGLAPGRGRDLGSVEAPPFLFAKQEKSLPQERREGRMSTFGGDWFGLDDAGLTHPSPSFTMPPDAFNRVWPSAQRTMDCQFPRSAPLRRVVFFGSMKVVAMNVVGNEVVSAPSTDYYGIEELDDANLDLHSWDPAMFKPGDHEVVLVSLVPANVLDALQCGSNQTHYYDRMNTYLVEFSPP